jgi:hypothetical protein
MFLNNIKILVFVIETLCSFYEFVTEFWQILCKRLEIGGTKDKLAYFAYPSIVAGCSDNAGGGYRAQTDLSTAGNTVHFEKLIILQLIEKYPISKSYVSR